MAQEVAGSNPVGSTIEKPAFSFSLVTEYDESERTLTLAFLSVHLKEDVR